MPATLPLPRRGERPANRDSRTHQPRERTALMALAAAFCFVSTTGGLGSARAQGVDDAARPKPAGAGVSATRTTVDALSNAITASFFGGPPLFRIQLGKSGPELERGAAASAGDSPWSLWATPVYSSINNRIEPLLSEGSVTLVIAGVEYAIDDATVAGISYTRDWVRVESTERVRGVDDRLSTVRGVGWTIAPYLARQINPEWLFDLSVGAGVNDLKSTQRSDASVATPRDDRSFAALGFTYLKPLGKGVLLTGRAGFSLTRDNIGSFTSVSAAGVVQELPGSESRLKQLRVGGQLSYQMGSFSPFVGVYGLLNDFSISTTGSVIPREYSEVAQFVAGVNASTGPLYGALALQHERDRSQVRAYFGLRY